MKPTAATRTVVIGGGVAGLASAILLARDGHEVTLLERNPDLGGRAATMTTGGFRFELGPSWYLMPGVFDHFFRLAGTSTEAELDLVTLDPGYQVFSEPAPGSEAVISPAPPVTIPFGRAAARSTFERLEPGSGPAFDRYLASATHALGMAERYFLYNPFTRVRSLLTPEVVRSLPTLARLLLTSLEKFAAHRFRHPVIRQILGYPAVFLGTAPQDAPAIYHLMSQLDLEEGVSYPMGGFTALISRLTHLARANGVDIRTGAEARAILTEPRAALAWSRRPRPRGPRARVTGVRWRDDSGGEHVAPADTVVSGADLHHTETQLLPSELATYPESWWRRRRSGPGAILVTLGIEGKLPELTHHSLLFTRDWRVNFEAIFGRHPAVPDPASIYVCKPSATDPHVAPAGDENLFILIPVPADPGLGGAGDPTAERAADAAIDQISAWAQIPGLRERIRTRDILGPADFVRDYHSWRGGMLGPAHILRQSAMFRAQNASRRVSGLYYAGATTAPGVGVPMCLISAELVLKRIRGDHSPGPLPVP